MLTALLFACAWRHAAAFVIATSTTKLSAPLTSMTSVDGLAGDTLNSPEVLFSKWGVRVNTQSQRYEFNCVDPDYVVDELEFTIIKNPGLGIQLTEVAENADDNVGIVVVSGVIADSPAADSPLKPGDVLSSVSGIDVQAKTYDSLLSVLSRVGPVVPIKAKRLSKRFKARLEIYYANDESPPLTDTIYANENLRRALLARGVNVNDPALGPSCAGDFSCNVCGIDIIDGSQILTEATAPERANLKSTPTWRLACQADVKDLDPSQDVPVLRLRLFPHRHEYK